MKNLYPQPHQASNGSFDDYDSVIGNEFSVNSTSAKSGTAGGGSNNSDDMDDLSSLGNSHFGPNSAANSPVRMNLAAAAAASTNAQPWRQQHAPMTPLSSGSYDSNALRVGDVSVILGDDSSRLPGGSGDDIESIGGDSLLMMPPPARLERDAKEWKPTQTHAYDAATSKYLQLGPLGDELTFGGDNNSAANNNHPRFTGGRDNLNADADYDDEDDDTHVGFLPQGRFGACLMIGSTMLVVGALVIAVVAILNLNAASNSQNDSPKFNIDAVGGVNDVIPTTLTPTAPSTVAPTVPAPTHGPTYEPTYLTDYPTPMPQKTNESPIIASNSTTALSKEPTTDEPTPSPTKAPVTDEPTSAPSKAPTTVEPTAGETEAPSKAPSTDAPTPSPTEAAPLSTSSPSKAPTSDEPTASPIETASISNVTSSPTQSPTPQSLLSTGSDAFDRQDVHLYLVSDDLYVRQEWKSNFEKLGNNKAKFLFHVGSATPSSDDCPEEAYGRTEKSLSFSTFRAFSVPGNNDYPDCPSSSLAWNHYTEHLMNIDKKYWPSTRKYEVKRDPERPENFAFLYRRTLFVGLNMVSNEGQGRTENRLEQNLKWLDANVAPHEDKINAIFITGYGSLQDLPSFRDAIISKKQGEWKDKMVVYARRAEQTKLVVDVEGVKGFHEITVGKGSPVTDVHLDLTSEEAPRVGYRYSDGSSTPLV